MKLAKLQIQNFRSFENETIVFDDYVCLVGANGAGKSTILLALNVFFRNTSGSSTDLANLSREDFHLGDTSKPIQITLTFSDLSANAKQDLSAYVRQDQLVVSAQAIWDEKANSAEVRQFGSRLVMSDFAPYFKAEEEGAKADGLRAAYTEIQKKYSELPKPGTMAAMKQALRSYEDANPAKCTLVESGNQFYGWSKGSNLLRKHLQWIFLPAVKDPISEQDEGRSTALGELLERTIRAKVNFDEKLDSLRTEAIEKYQQFLNAQQPVLDELTKSLTKRVQVWTHTAARVNVKWQYIEGKSVSVSDPLARLYAGEHEFLGELARLGHGLQRSVLVALLQELAESDEAAEGTLLLAIEEPELYQHPPQARHVASVLEGLAQKNSQVFVTTHSPYFVSGKGFESVRMVRGDRKKKASVVTSLTHQQLSESLAKALGHKPRTPTATMAAIEQIMQPSQKELFFCGLAVLVEGLEDVAYLSTYLQLTGRWTEFRRYGCHFVVSGGKGNMSRPLAIAKGLSLPAFVIFDADGNDAQNKKSHERDNTCILNLCSVQKPDPFPKDVFWGDHVVMWPESFGKAVIESVTEKIWKETVEEVRKEFELEDISNKNGTLISAAVEKMVGKKIGIANLEALSKKLIDFAAATWQK